MSGIYGNPGQTNYGAAKAGIATFTLIAAEELGRYGVTANAIAPGALTRLTEDLGLPDEMRRPLRSRVGRPGRDVARLCRSRPTSPVRSSSRRDRSSASPRGGDAVRTSTTRRSTPREVDGVVRELLAKATPRTKMSELN